MKPYYERDGIVLYHADCREVLPQLGKFDLVLTDPPYGIGESNAKNLSRVRAAKPKDYGEYTWDKQPVSQDLIDSIIAQAKHSIIWGGNYYTVAPSSCWLVWDKMNTGDFADCELAWTNLPKAVRIIRHLWNGMIRKGNEERFHPTQKPLGVMEWALLQAPFDCKTVLDPFTGSGTTGVACIRQGRQFTGIEIEEKYCEVAAKRFDAELDKGRLFNPDELAAMQMTLEVTQ